MESCLVESAISPGLSGNKCGPQRNVRYKYVEDNIQIAAKGFPDPLTEEEKS